LEKSILGRTVTLREEKVILIFGIDVIDSERVAYNLNLITQTFYCYGILLLVPA
jgi:hypothetical protein